jgi:SAM-dependent MidA family methyltransferase
VEISPVLQRQQQERMDTIGLPVLWHATLDDVPTGPSIIVANEFFDALPVYQAVKRANGWHERVIEIGPSGDLVFGVASDPLLHFDTTLPRGLRQSPDGSIYEWRSDRVTLELGRRVRTDGAALVIDYGHAWYGLGETLQAVAGHQYADPLRSPGQVDLTAHVDFRAVAVSAETIGARIHGPVSQRDFLRRLGIDKRAAALKTRAAREKEAEIDIALGRLTATGTGGMGELFKALAIADPRLGQLPGFYP